MAQRLIYLKSLLQGAGRQFKLQHICSWMIHVVREMKRTLEAVSWSRPSPNIAQKELYNRAVSFQLSVSPAQQFLRSRKRNSDTKSGMWLWTVKKNKHETKIIRSPSVGGVCPKTQLIKKEENTPLTNDNPLELYLKPPFFPNLFWPFPSLLPSALLRFTRTRRSAPSCRLQTAGPGSPSGTGQNWSGPPEVLGAPSPWRCKRTRRRWTAGSRRSLQRPRPRPIGSKLCQPELPGLSAAVDTWPDGREDEDYYRRNVSPHIHLFRSILRVDTETTSPFSVSLVWSHSFFLLTALTAGGITLT